MWKALWVTLQHLWTGSRTSKRRIMEVTTVALICVTGIFGTGVQHQVLSNSGSVRIQQSRAICSALVFNLWPICLYRITEFGQDSSDNISLLLILKLKKTIHKAIHGTFPPRLSIYITGVCCVISVRHGRSPHGFEIHSYIRNWETQRCNLRKRTPFYNIAAPLCTSTSQWWATNT